MNRINLTRADMPRFKADWILICQRNKIDVHIFDAFNNHANFPLHMRHNTTDAYKAIVNKSGKCEISKCAQWRNAITGVIHYVSARRLSCRRGRDKTACHYKTESLFHYYGTIEEKLKKKGPDFTQAKQKETRNFAQRNFFPFVLSYGATRNADNSHCRRNVERNSRKNKNMTTRHINAHKSISTQCNTCPRIFRFYERDVLTITSRIISFQK